MTITTQDERTHARRAVKTLDMISDAASICANSFVEKRNSICEYALELGVKAAPVQIFKILKAQADLYQERAFDLHFLATDTWCAASKIDLAYMKSA